MLVKSVLIKPLERSKDDSGERIILELWISLVDGCFVFNNISINILNFTPVKKLTIKVKLPVHTIKSNEEKQSLFKKVFRKK